MLFAVTVINYLDRQTLAALAPYLKEHFGWNNVDYQFVVNAFQISYTIMQTVVGRLLDILGTRVGIASSVALYSVIGIMTACAQGLWSFSFFRLFLGAGEAANNPGGSKVVSEWFPAKERAYAVALFNSGCAVGGALAPFIVYYVYSYFNNWRIAFILTGMLGLFWLILWIKFYRTPEQHPRLSQEELLHIQAGRTSSPAAEKHIGWLQVLSYRQTWGLILGRFLLDPFWFLVTNWYALFLLSKGFDIKASTLGASAPFLGAILGNLFAGALSSFLVSRGWPTGRSRRTVLMIFGPSMFILLGSLYTNSYPLLLLIAAYSMFAYNCCGTMFLTLPTDVFHTRAVGTVMGLAGTSAGISTMLTTFMIGVISEKYGFTPIIVAASIIPCLATLIFISMVRAGKKDDPKGILQHF